jgi:hypothetical protein
LATSSHFVPTLKPINQKLAKSLSCQKTKIMKTESFSERRRPVDDSASRQRLVHRVQRLVQAQHRRQQVQRRREHAGNRQRDQSDQLNTLEAA